MYISTEMDPYLFESEEDESEVEEKRKEPAMAKDKRGFGIPLKRGGNHE